MSPPGIPPQIPIATYFDDRGEPERPIRNVGDLRAAVRKCLATAERAQREMAAQANALTRAATRLQLAANQSQYLQVATAQFGSAAAVVRQAHQMLQATRDDGETYLQNL